MPFRSLRVVSFLLTIPLVLMGSMTRADEGAPVKRTEDVIYGRKYGTALTLDVFAPTEKANGLGLIWVVSGGWFSAHAAVSPPNAQEFLKRGYTVFTVVHGSQPKFTIPEIVQDMHRAVRFIRSNAAQYNIDPDRIGIMGGSAGGHLSLMQGTAGDSGNPDAKDPIDRCSSRVQAVACFFPPTDFLNYGRAGEIALGCGTLKDFRAPFDFREYDDKVKAFVTVTDVGRLLEIGRTISPVYQVTSDDPPTLISHGDADKLVPMQQAELIVQRFQQAGVPCELVVRPGAGHGGEAFKNDLALFADWFDKHLPKK